MEFIPLISPSPLTNLKSSRISKAWREIFNENENKQKNNNKKYKTFYPRSLIKTSNKEQEKDGRTAIPVFTLY